MEMTATGQQSMDRETRSVHAWRVFQLMRLGMPGSLAEIYADQIDWHQIARLVQRGRRGGSGTSEGEDSLAIAE
jgi:hypothetical protein